MTSTVVNHIGFQQVIPDFIMLISLDEGNLAKNI